MKMNDLTKMMIFMFLGLVIAILVLGFSRPTTTATTGFGTKTLPTMSTSRNEDEF